MRHDPHRTSLSLPLLAFPVALSVMLVVASSAAPGSTRGEAPPSPPVSVFAELDGTWEGSFVGRGELGDELYRLFVRQTYRTIDAHTQTVEIEDRMPDGTVILGKGENTARRREDGSLELRCRVEKSNGERVEHVGRLVEEPNGDRTIVWESRSEDRTEAFRERVRHEDGTDVYEIDGVGRYGDRVVTMTGRYYRIEPEVSPDR